MTKNQIAKNIKFTMAQQRMKQCKLVKLAKIPNQTLSTALSGKKWLSLEQLVRICRVLKIRIEWVIGEEK